MIYDCSVREDDRHELIDIISDHLRDAYRLSRTHGRKINRYLLALLYRKVQFGFYSVEQLYEIALRAELANMDELSLFTFAPLRAKDELSLFDSISFGWNTSSIGREIPKEHDPQTERKETNTYDPMDTVIGMGLITKHLYDDPRYYLNAIRCMKYIPPEDIRIEMPEPKVELTSYNNLFQAIKNSRFVVDTFDTYKPE